MQTLKALLTSDIERFHKLKGCTIETVGITKLLLTCFSPRLLPVTLYRLSHAFQSKGFSILGKFFSLLNFFVFGIEISPKTIIGPGLFFPHTQGTVLGARKIGSNAIIFQQVTLGAKDLDLGLNLDTRPVLGDNVTVGAGAKILGGVRIGNSAVIGANSVVLSDVPDGATCVGVPGTLLIKS